MAKQFNKYAAGRKVYGGGRSNPTSGTVDPSGYIDRAANNKASDRRSGLAASAISRRLGTGSRPAAVPGQFQSSAAPSGGGSAWGAGPGDASNPAFNAWKAASSPTGQNVVAPGVSDSMKPQPIAPQAIDSTGTLGHVNAEQQQGIANHTAQTEAVNNWEMPTDFDHSTAAAAIEAEKANFLASLVGQETNFRSAAGRRIRDLKGQIPGAREGLLNNFAGRGMAYSGKYGTSRGDLDQGFANAETSINEDLTNSISGLETQRAAGISGFSGRASVNDQQHADRLASDPRFRAPVVTQAPLVHGGVPVANDEALLQAQSPILRRLGRKRL